MSQFSMTCTCGHVISVDASDKQDAAKQMKTMMTADAIAAHFKDKHPGQAVLPVPQVHALIDRSVHAA